MKPAQFRFMHLCDCSLKYNDLKYNATDEPAAVQIKSVIDWQNNR